MVHCPGMGEIIDEEQYNLVADEVLTFIMENGICPEELKRFMELMNAYSTELSYQGQLLLAELVSHMPDDDVITFAELRRKFLKPAVFVAKKPVIPPQPKKASIKASVKGKKK